MRGIFDLKILSSFRQKLIGFQLVLLLTMCCNLLASHNHIRHRNTQLLQFNALLHGLTKSVGIKKTDGKVVKSHTKRGSVPGWSERSSLALVPGSKRGLCG